jgi:hypothetical protein
MWRIRVGLSLILVAVLPAGCVAATAMRAEAAAPTCRVGLPTGTEPARGNRVALAAAATDAARVDYYLSGALLGQALPTAYGWLYTPDGGRTWGWDSTRVANGVYALTCKATAADGTVGTSAAVTFTVDNITPQQWKGRCWGKVASTPADYQRAFDYRSGGWAGADGAIPIRLPDGRVLWLFGDTFAGQIDAGNALLPGWRMPRNTVVVQSGTCFVPVTGGTPDRATSYLPEISGEWFWPSGGYVDTSVRPAVVRIVSSAVRSEPTCGFGWRVSGMRIHTLSLPDLRVVSSQSVPYNPAAANMPTFGTGIFRDGDWVYLYGKGGGFQCGGFAEGGPFAPGTHLARVPAGGLTSGPWEYWAGGSWSQNVNLARPVAYDGDNVPQPVRRGGRFVATAKTGFLWVFGSQVYAWTATSPAGPWQPVVGSDGKPVNIVPPEVTFPQSRMFYGGRLHDDIPGTSPANPLLVFSTNGVGCDEPAVPCTRDNDVGKNVLLYGPHFTRPVGLEP